MDFEGKNLECCFTKKDKNWVTFLGNGKIMMLDRSQLGKIEIEEGIYYNIIVHKELVNVAFCKVIDEVFLPRIIIFGEKIIVVRKIAGELKRDTVSDIQEALEILNAEKKIMIVRR